jgi:hypothetical protein
MVARPSIVVVLFGALASLGASYRTPNFVVEAPTYPIAQQIGQYAEHYRREKALLWLGQEMPQWPEPCPLRVTVTMNGSGGATSFAFDRGRILGMDMHVEGSLDRLLASVVPHEVTHTVFAHYFRQPVPRWADEGGSVLSEDQAERDRHDQLVRQILNTPGRAIPLRRLFSMMKYPPDVMVLYAEGYSVSDFLVSKSSRSVFLAFIAQGMRGDWDGAVRAHYRFNNVEELEHAWVQYLREKRQQPTDIARNPRPAESSNGSRVVTRQTVPPAQPILQEPMPIVRAAAPEPTPRATTPVSAMPARPGYLPEYQRASVPGQPASGQPVPLAPVPGQVLLGPPQFEGAPQFETPSGAVLGAPMMLPGHTP